MGAHNFAASAYAKTAEDAYNNLVEEAIYDHGHDAYNGTISTTFGFVIIPFKDGESSVEWMDRMMEHPDVEKWENCACVEATHVEKNSNGYPLWHFSGWAAS